jgi:hypothetical protein
MVGKLLRGKDSVADASSTESALCGGRSLDNCAPLPRAAIIGTDVLTSVTASSVAHLAAVLPRAVSAACQFCTSRISRGGCEATCCLNTNRCPFSPTP